MSRSVNRSLRRGLTLIEVLVSIGLLAILAASLVAVLPQLSRSTRAATEDTTLSTVVYDVLERLVSDWSNSAGWDPVAVLIDGSAVDLVAHIDAVTDGLCDVDVQDAESGAIRIVTVTCTGGAGPDIEMRAAYGSPGADGAN